MAGVDLISNDLVAHRALDMTTVYQYHFLSDDGLHAKSLLPRETFKKLMQRNKKAGTPRMTSPKT